MKQLVNKLQPQMKVQVVFEPGIDAEIDDKTSPGYYLVKVSDASGTAITSWNKSIWELQEVEEKKPEEKKPASAFPIGSVIKCAVTGKLWLKRDGDKVASDGHTVCIGGEFILASSEEAYEFFDELEKSGYCWSYSKKELIKIEKKSPLYFIRGIEGRQHEIIKMLEEKGGKIQKSSIFCLYPYESKPEYIYFITPEGNIDWSPDFHNAGKLVLSYGTELHLPEKVQNPSTFYIRGNSDRRKEVIEMLVKNGGKNGKNQFYWNGDNSNYFYFINKNGYIDAAEDLSETASILKKLGTELYLLPVTDKTCTNRRCPFRTK